MAADSPPPPPADVTAAQPRPWLPWYSLPPMPWAGMQLQFPEFNNPIPNIGLPDMPFPLPFVRPSGAGAEPTNEKDEKGDEEAVGVDVGVEQGAQEQSMMMLMTWWAMCIRASWEKLALQQQQQQQQTALAEPDGPPPYSPNPPETTILATTIATATAAPVDTATESIASASGSRIRNQNQNPAPGPVHTYPPTPVSPPPPPPLPLARPHRRVDYGPAANGIKGIPEHEINKYGYRSLVRRARGKKKDKMLIFFWIPVLFGTSPPPPMSLFCSFSLSLVGWLGS